MVLRPAQGHEKRPLSGNRSSWKRRPPLCHPERSRGICSSGDLSWECFSAERTPISCHAALDMAAYAPFRKERRMKCVNATNLHRKSGGA